MSDYIPKDPLTPNPNDQRGHDRYGNAKFEPAVDEGAGKGPYILLGLLAAIGLIGGLLYFNGAPTTNSDVAQARNPAPIERTAPPIERTTPPAAAPSAPSLTPTNPAPATPAAPAERPMAPPATPQQ